MRARLVAIVLVLLPVPALAKAWRNVNPGSTKGVEVVKRFGEPTKRLARGDKQVLAYYDDEAIEGSKQAEFMVGTDGKVEQIAVFPAAAVEKAAIADTFGPSCSDKQQPNCFVQKVSEDDLKPYLWYENLGLVVFLNADGKTVQSFLYVKPGPPKQAKPASTQQAKTTSK